MTLGLTPFEIGELYRSAARYQFAATQDKHPAVAFLHNSYAVAILDKLRDLASDQQVQMTIRENPAILRAEARGFQDKMEKTVRELSRRAGLGELGETPFYRTWWGVMLLGGAFGGLASALFGRRVVYGAAIGAGLGLAKHLLINGIDALTPAPMLPGFTPLPEVAMTKPTYKTPGIF